MRMQVRRDSAEPGRKNMKRKRGTGVRDLCETLCELMQNAMRLNIRSGTPGQLTTDNRQPILGS
jgi:hypothetical protein